MQNVELVERHPQGFDRYKLRTHLKLIPRLGCLEGPLSKCQNAARGPELRAENRCQATNQTSKPTTKNGQFSRLLFDEPAQAANARPLPVLVAFPVKIYAYKSACYARSRRARLLCCRLGVRTLGLLGTEKAWSRPSPPSSRAFGSQRRRQLIEN